MNKSESIASLAKALSLFQGEVRDVLKDKKGHNCTYGDLSQVLDVARPLLSKYELSVVQLPGMNPEWVNLETVLMHSSGEWIASFMEVPFERGKMLTNAQSVGGIVTYMRRYAACAMLGIAQTDDDGSLGATGNGHAVDAYSPPSRALPPNPLPSQAPPQKVTDVTYAALCSSMMTHEISEKSQEQWKVYFKVKTLSELSEHNARAIINQIKKRFEPADGSEIEFLGSTDSELCYHERPSS